MAGGLVIIRAENVGSEEIT